MNVSIHYTSTLTYIMYDFIETISTFIQNRSNSIQPLNGNLISDKNKTGILPNISPVSIAVWIHHLNLNEMLWEKARSEYSRMIHGISIKS